MMDIGGVQFLFADLQPTLVAGGATIPPEALMTSAVVLARAAPAFGIPTTFSIVPERGQAGTLLPDLQEFSTRQNTFQRTTASVFLDQPTASAIAANERRTIVIAGFSAEVVILHSALAAIEAGYRVHLALDAIGGRSQRTEEAAFRQIERNGGIPTSVLSVITGLAPDFSCAPGNMVLELTSALRR